MKWLHRLLGANPRPAHRLPPEKLGMPHEAIVTDPELVRAWWEWMRNQVENPGAAPGDDFVIWLLREPTPFSIRLAREPDGSIEKWSPNLYLSISFRTAADLSNFRAQWGGLA